MPVSPLSTYRTAIAQAIARGDATEHTHRPALKTLIDALATGVVATNEPKKHVDCGVPDYKVSHDTSHGPLTIGHIEAKDVGASLALIEKDSQRAAPTSRDGEQLKRYRKGLPNLILTDYLEFRWYVDGDRRTIARLGSADSKRNVVIEKGGPDSVEALLRAFLEHKAQLISKPKDLAERLARLTHFIRDIVVQAFETKTASSTLRGLHEAFAEVLIPDLSTAAFADMFSQTIAYGLFAARLNHSGPSPFRRQDAAVHIPKTNPFLRKLFGTITGPDLDDEPFVGFVDDLAQLLADTDMGAVLAEFGKRTKREDPIVHFYETFLTAYDPKLRKKRGVYFTPEPVVSYIVRSVDYLLRTRFNCPNGLADTGIVSYKHDGKEETIPRVLLLDPACGTGTFLYAVVDLIREQFIQQGNAGKWPLYVRENLLKRLFGFELLMAPYAVAHLKLGMQLAGQDLPEEQRQTWGCDLTGDDRLGVFLTNTLEEALKESELMMAKWVSDEANAAAEIKRDLPIMVVLGNPPYAGESANRSKMIVDVPRTRLIKGQEVPILKGGQPARVKKAVPTFIGKLLRDYYFVDGQPLHERTTKWLQDDYVKFIRFGQWRIDQTGAGVLTFITPHGYLDNPTFRGMRQQLMRTFDEIWVLDLHGNSNKKERCPDGSPDVNVFDDRQGVAISIFVRLPERLAEPNVRHAECWGTREAKYAKLLDSDAESTTWTQLSVIGPSYRFVPEKADLRAEFEQSPILTDCMPLRGPGMTTARDHVVVDFDPAPLLQRAMLFRDSRTSDSEVCRILDIPEKKGWDIGRSRKLIRTEPDLGGRVKPLLHRPFDHRLIFWHDSLVWRTVKEVMGEMTSASNLALITTRQTRDSWGVFATRRMITHKALAAYDINTLFPLYLYPMSHELHNSQVEMLAVSPWPDGKDGRRPNLAPEFVDDMAKRLNLSFVSDGQGDLRETFGPEDVFHYIYAVFHSPTYRSRYAEFLKIDFPRIPLTANLDLFRALVEKGRELVGLHMLESSALAKAITRYPVAGPNIVDPGHPRYVAPGEPSPEDGKPIGAGRVYINKGDPKAGVRGQHFEGVPQEVWEFWVGGYQPCQKWLKDRRGRTLSNEDIEHYGKIVVALQRTIRLMAEIDAAIPEWPIS